MSIAALQSEDIVADRKLSNVMKDSWLLSWQAETIKHTFADDRLLLGYKKAASATFSLGSNIASKTYL